MNIVKATHRYEEWLGRHTPLVKRDLRLKHERMAEAVFPFLRATFYRWIQIWPEVCSDLAKAPRVLAVGDLHVENFGTWRDLEGRLVWGVNDFDEAAVLPYTVDLVRLATSALFAIDDGHLALKPKDACASILEGYKDSLANGGRPYVLEEENAWLRQIATGVLRDPVHFWKRMDTLPRIGEFSVSAREALEHLMPERGLTYRTVRRVAGLGSLGHIRVVAIALCQAPGSLARPKHWSPPRFTGSMETRDRRDPVPCHHQPRRPLPRSFCAVARTLDRSPLVAPLFAHRTKRSPHRPRRTPPAFRHGMGNGQRSPRNRGREKIHPSPPRPPQTGLAVRSRQKDGKGGHQRLAGLEKV